MAETVTRETEASVEGFLNAVENETRRADGLAVLKMMRRVTGVKPKMWGPAMVGFGKTHYKYESGREGDMFRVGFSPRKTSLVVYVIAKDATIRQLLTKLGTHKTGVSCLYIKTLADIDLAVLEAVVARSWELSA